MAPSAPAQAQVSPQAQAPNPVSNPFAALLGKPGNTTALDDKQRAIIQRVDNYLSSVRTLEGNFVQVGPDGSRSKGEFYISKPGKVRFEYDPPSPISIVADGQSLVVRDRNLATQDVYPLSQTPLRFLLADHVNLLKDTNLVAVYADDVFVTVVVEEKNGLVGTSRLMIMFSANDMSAQAVDGDRPAGLRHHRRGVQSRHHHQARPQPVPHRLYELSQLTIFPFVPAKAGTQGSDLRSFRRCSGFPLARE